MKFILFLLRSSWPVVVVSVICGTVAGACSAALISLINDKLNSPNSWRASSISIYAGLVLLMLSLNFVSQILLQRLGQKIIYGLRMQMCKQVLATPLRSLEKAGSSRIMAAFTDDIGAIIGAFLNTPTLCINLTIVVCCIGYLAWISPISLLAYLLGFLIMAIISTQLLQKRGSKHLSVARENWGELMAHLRALTDGIKELKLHNDRRRSFVSDLFDPAAIRFQNNSNVGMTIYTLSTSWSQVLYFLFIGATLFMLRDLDLKVLIGYTLTVLYMRAPITMLLNVVPSFSRANIALKKIEQLGMSLKGSGPEEAPAQQLDPVSHWAQLDVSGVTYTYKSNDHNFTFGPVNLTLNPGEIVFIIGGNGSGKTTFAKLLTGMYTPDGGEIRINGVPVTEENREYYWQHFSAVFSDFYLFDKLLGLDRPDLDTQASEYIARLQLDHKVEVKDGTLSTTQLSQGQRKRLALLTAYLEDRPIYVFDEWAADQDPIFKDMFYLHLLPDLKEKGKAVLVITHDDRYYDIADRIVKLDYGKVESEEAALRPQELLAETPVA